MPATAGTDSLQTDTKIHALVGADHLLPTMEADTLIADKAFAPMLAYSSRWLPLVRPR